MLQLQQNKKTATQQTIDILSFLKPYFHQMKLFLFAVVLTLFLGCNGKDKNEVDNLNQIAVKYVKLGLEIGQYDPDFVDAYYGPDSLKPAAIKDTVLPVKKFQSTIDSLLQAVRQIKSELSKEDSVFPRADYLEHQLIAFSRRIKIASGVRESFEKESSELFDVTVPEYDSAHFVLLIAKLDSTLPGSGPIETRLKALNEKFIIPKDKIDTVFRVAIAEARRRTYNYFKLPETESFTLEYVTGKPWSGYNWYKGNYSSLIQINTDLPIMIDRAIDLGCHEGYPGHHVYNVLLEKNLYRDKGWIELSLYPLFSPQSFIAEGSANYGIDMAFPVADRIRFTKEVLLPVAGLDTTNVEAYFKSIDLKTKLNYARNEVARGLINKTMTDEQGIAWLIRFGLSSSASAAKSISFIKKYGSYVICYNYGLDLVRSYIETAGGETENRWTLFGKLLSAPVNPGDLEKQAAKAK
jgi:hypothetical protein